MRIVVAAWGSDEAPSLDGPVVRDPRLAALGFRGIVPPGADMAADFWRGLAGLLGRRSAGAGILEKPAELADLPEGLISALETRAIWAKFGF